MAQALGVAAASFGVRGLLRASIAAWIAKWGTLQKFGVRMATLWCGVLGVTIFLSVLTVTAVEQPAGLDTFPRWQDDRLEGTGDEVFPFEPVPFLADLEWENPICLITVPGTRADFLVVERWGKVWQVRSGVRAQSPLIRLTTEGSRKGVNAFGLTFHPSFPEIPYIYLRWNRKEAKTAYNYLTRYTVSDADGLKLVPDSEVEILRWESNGHNGGDLVFGPDGFLYICSGDGSTPGDPENVGQLTDDLLAAILRIDVDGGEDGRPYRIPKDNPFIGIPGVAPEQWAYGLRNPWRMCFRPGTDELWLGDNGDEHWELVHRIQRGANYGWSAFEGSHLFRASNTLGGPTKVLSLPTVEHPHEEMRSVIGGLWLQGDRYPTLMGHYIYGCYFTGRVWAFGMNEDQPEKPRRIADARGGIVSFTQLPNGELLVVCMDKGLLQLVPRTDPPEPRPIPKRLSATGLFTSTSTHAVAPGLLPYDLNLPVYRDDTTRARFIGMPEAGEIRIQSRPPGLSKLDPAAMRTTAGVDRWQMPQGAVLMQTFELFGQRVETQISYKDRGEWKFLSYHWQTQQDAELVPPEGRTVDVSAPDGTSRSYRIPARVDCTACHTQRSMFVLGLNEAQLNRDMDYRPLGGKMGNQLDTFKAIGFFPAHKKFPAHAQRLQLPAPDQIGVSLEDRARAYLHVNCAHCHRETGLGGRASFELLNWLPTPALGVVHARPHVGLPGGPDGTDIRLIRPGNPELSEIYRRMVTEGPGRMPLLGTDIPDAAGAALIGEWISSMAPAR